MEERIPLTDAEWHIMTRLWDESPRSIMELTRALTEETGWTRHVVIALLKRMEAKGTVRMAREGRGTNVYPAVEKEKVAREQTKTLLDRLFGGRFSLLLADMVEQENLTDEELGDMMRTIEEARRKRDEYGNR